MAFFKNSKFGEQNEISVEDFDESYEKIENDVNESIELDKKRKKINNDLFNKIKNNKEFTSEQIEAIADGLDTDIDISILINPNFNALKIKELINTFKLGDDPKKYVDLNFMQLRYVINYELNKFKKAEKEGILYQIGPDQAKEINFKLKLFEIMNKVLYSHMSYAIISDINNRLIINYYGYENNKDKNIIKQCTVSEGIGAEINQLFAFTINSSNNIEGKIIEKTKGSYKNTCSKWSEKEVSTNTIDEKIQDLKKEAEKEQIRKQELMYELAMAKSGKRKRTEF